MDATETQTISEATVCCSQPFTAAQLSRKHAGGSPATALHYGTEGARGGTATPEQVWEGQVRRCVLTWLMLQRQHFAKHLQLGMFRTFVFP